MVEIGQVVMDVEVYDLDGTPLGMHTLWRDTPVVLTFLRHFGCQFCRAFLGTLRGVYPEFVKQGAALVAVAQGTPAQTAYYRHSLRLPFPMLADPTRTVFRAFGLGQVPLHAALSPQVVGRMVHLAAQGTLPGVGDHLRAMTGSNGSSLAQLSGTFIVGRGGVLRYSHRATRIDQQPSVADLLQALQDAS